MSILFLLTGIGVVNGLLAALYIWFKKERSIAETYFAALILALCIRIGKSVFYYFTDNPDRLILQIGLSACLFIGPLYYLYTDALSQERKKHSRLSKVLLPILLVTIVIVGMIFPYRLRPDIWNGYIIYGIYGVWILFLLLGLLNFLQIFKNQRPLEKALTEDQQYFLAISVSIIFITITYQLALFLGITYIWGALIFSFTFYYLLARTFIIQKPISPKRISEPVADGQAVFKKVREAMKKQKPYKQMGLKLNDLSQQLKIPKNTLSKVLNQEYAYGYSQFIKEYRVSEAKDLIKSRPELSFEGVGQEAGFKSKSAFYAAFKELVGCTPRVYKQNLTDQT